MHGLRFIALNRRGFMNSTCLLKEDIQLLQTKAIENHTRFLEGRSRELGRFIIALNKRGIRGRFTLLGWSLGNAFCLKLIQMIEERSLGELGAQLSDILGGYIIFGMFILCAMIIAVIYRLVNHPRCAVLDSLLSTTKFGFCFIC